MLPDNDTRTRNVLPKAPAIVVLRFGSPSGTGDDELGRTIAFLAECPGSASIDEQMVGLGPDDQVVSAGRHTFNKLEDLLAKSGMKLGIGDRIKVHDLSCITVSTATLVRLLTRWLRKGIAFEIASAGIVIEAQSDDKLYALLRALDGHHRHIHGIKTHRGDRENRGRRRLLDPGKLPAIRARLDVPGVTATEVAKELGVARSTLFNFLERYDGERGRGRDKKAVKRHPESARDDAHVLEREAKKVSADDSVNTPDR